MSTSTATVHCSSAYEVAVALEESVHVIEGETVGVHIFLSLASNDALESTVTVTVSTTLDHTGANPGLNFLLQNNTFYTVCSIAATQVLDFVRIQNVQFEFMASGSNVLQIPVTTLRDGTVEEEETFLLEITDVTGPAVINNYASVTTVVITDNQGKFFTEVKT